ncbi:LytTR family DNA-binding domain-containing protein [Companilactobacillus kimchiensis]|uniref:HTH LytTR-type domain-containing protein n=1 Tax=Companilactobacillus kimchiensis TaxID=993692 RepID=A0A0R2LDB6_9LACO|nr:LytTR family DNA-binding domain-containing protein [Companilactobacillus kimchiensis]KRN99913.1 hypothetical protein IV57_GL002245 [Companilactobacillus kimchiensis]
MKIEVNYHQDKELTDDEIQVVVKSKGLTADVQKVITMLENLDNQVDVIPLAVNDRIVLVQMDTIIAIEVYENELTVYTMDNNYQLRGKLNAMLQRLNGNFIQISKNTIINLNHLNSLEASFSSNMLAFLDNNLKLTVSRKYLSELKKSLGM